MLIKPLYFFVLLSWIVTIHTLIVTEDTYRELLGDDVSEESYEVSEEAAEADESDEADEETEKKNEKILHGDVVDIADHPYQVALVNTKFGRAICGGVLVKPRVVFTAAHCTHTRDNVKRKNLAVLAGANYVHDPEGHLHHIEKSIKHPDFSYFDFDNDFSVILLKEPVKKSEKVQPIEISFDEHSGGTQAKASGWGMTEYGRPSRELRAVDLEIEHHPDCQNHFPHVLHPRITENMVCVKPHRKSTFYGDSGGPLVVDNKLVGLVSFGRTVKPNKKTTVFTKVKNFVDFAEEVVPNEYKKD